MPQPDAQDAYVYLNGEILPAAQAAISPFDIGLLRGYAVFDLLQTIDGRPFMMREHLTRLRMSAEVMELTVPATDDELSAAIRELLRLNGHREATVRIVLTGGVSPDGMSFDPATPTLYIITHEMFEVPQEVYESGAALITEPHARQFPEAKTTNYLTWLKNHPRIDEAGAMDVLYHDCGIISEAATASFYIVSDGSIHAPASNVLWGTVGSLVIERASREIPVVYRDIPLDEVFAADEAFLTSSVRGVVPIVRVDDRTIGDGSVGPVTTRLMELCREAMCAFED